MQNTIRRSVQPTLSRDISADIGQQTSEDAFAAGTNLVVATEIEMDGQEVAIESSRPLAAPRAFLVTADLWPGRSQAQEIVPCLFLTNYFGSRNVGQLRRDHISHIVVCAGELPMMYPNKFAYLVLDGFADNTHTQLQPHFARVFPWVKRAIDEGGVVLFHCASGVSRSAAMMTAYLMWDRDWSSAQALQCIGAARPIISPNPGFLEQLRLLEPMMQIIAPAGSSLGTAEKSQLEVVGIREDASARRL